jgi:lysozyme family protein
MDDLRFETSLPFVLSWEGGFVDDPDDPGGRTNKGITQAVYSQSRAELGLPDADVANITDDEVKTIYLSRYWQPAHSPDFSPELDLVQFDTAVNMGVGRAIRFLQQTLACGVDGAFGPMTAAAVAGCDPVLTAAAYCKVREQYYRNLVQRDQTLGKYLNGWMNRLNALRGKAGIPTYEAVVEIPSHTAKIPDIGVNPTFDF